MQFWNPFGQEVNISEETWNRLVHDRPFEARKYARADVGADSAGPKNKILLLLFENGIGDVVHALPAIRAKMDSGFHVAVGCNPHHAAIYARLGCEIIEEKEPQFGIAPKYWNDFGRIHSLRHWCRTHDEETGGDVKLDRFEQFARYLGVTLPASFDWRPVLLPKEKIKSSPTDLVLGLDSTSSQRTYPHHQALHDELVSRMYTVRSMGLPGITPNYMENLTTDGLIAAVDSARCVVAVDAGVLALALALGKPVVALMGPTTDSIIIGQFSRYRSLDDVTVLRSGLPDARCLRPCNFSMRRGFQVNNKCNVQADCMREITIPTILSALETLWQKHPKSKPLNKSSKQPRTKSRPRREIRRMPTSAKASTKSASEEKSVSLPILPVMESNP